MANFNININSYSSPDLNLITESTTPCEIVLSVNFYVDYSDYKLYIWGSEESITPVLKNGKILYTVYTDPGADYEFYVTANDDVINTLVTSDTLQHVAGESPSNTDAYVFFNTKTVDIDDSRAAKSALQEWYDEYKVTYNLTGDIYFLPVEDGRYLTYTSMLWNQDNYTIPAPDATGSPWTSEIAKLPIDFNTTQWIPPKNIITFCLTDAVNDNYHSISIDDGFGNFNLLLNDPNLNQPTRDYYKDYLEYLNQYQNNYNYIVNILLPVPRPDYTGSNSPTAAMILHSIAAMEAKVLTSQEIDDINPQVDVSILETTNPYNSFSIPNTFPPMTLQPLKNLGWIGNFSEKAPVSEVFNDNGFKSKINNLIFNNRPDC